MSIFGNIFGGDGIAIGGYPIVNKGDITINTDFPLLAQVEAGWLYNILADVTDNAGAPYTNTNLSFYTDDKIYWTGTTWTLAQTERIWLDNGVIITKYNSGNDIDLSGGTSFFDVIKAKDATGLQILDKDNVLLAKLNDGGLVEIYKLLLKNQVSGPNILTFDTLTGNERIELKLKKAGADSWFVRSYNDEPASTSLKNRLVITNAASNDIITLHQDKRFAVGTNFSKSFFEVNGSRGYKILNVNSASVSIDQATFISVNYTATGNVDIELPDASLTWNSNHSIGRLYRVSDTACNSGTNRIRINRKSATSDTITTTTTGNTYYDINEDGKVIDIQQIGISTWKVC